MRSLECFHARGRGSVSGEGVGGSGRGRVGVADERRTVGIRSEKVFFSTNVQN